MTSEFSSQPQVHEHAPEYPPISDRVAALVVSVAVVAVVVSGMYAILTRHHHNEVLADTTNELSAPTVTILTPKPGAVLDNFMLPGNVTAYTDAPIYARTNGYLVHWYYDLGASVKKGTLLAEISAPELDQQLTQAQADLLTAETNAKNAHVQADRYKGLVGMDAVSKFDTDTFVTQEAATASTVKSAKANVDRLKELQGFEKVYAPFDGVITSRNVDTGQLINSGASQELFHMQAVNTLRVYTNVPQIYRPSVKKGETINLTFPEFPGKTYQGTLVRTADALDPTNRTLLVEIDVDNRSGDLAPGSLAQVHFKASSTAQSFIVPVSALIFRHEGPRIGTIVNGNRAHLLPVTIGEDDGATVQIIVGLNADDKVIQDPPDSLVDGEKVSIESQASQNGGGM